MDRIDAMRVFVAALDAGSLAAAGRRLGHSPAAVSRAIAFLEAHVGTQLLHRTTRSIRLSEAGERYAAACRRVLSDLEEADMLAAGERAAPRGLLTVGAPLVSGTRILRPILDEFLDANPEVRAKLFLLDRPVSLVDEGVDVALRIAHLPDSSLVAIRIGEVRRVVCAAPAYLAGRPPVAEPADLAGHTIITVTTYGQDSWTFAPASPNGAPRHFAFTPRLMVNTVEAAVEFGDRRPRRHDRLLLSSGRACARRPARGPARPRRDAGAAGASHHAGRAPGGAEGARLRRFRGAPPQGRVRSVECVDGCQRASRGTAVAINSFKARDVDLTRGAQESPPLSEQPIQRKLAAILAADVAGYTRLMGIDETGTLTQLKALRREIVDPAIAARRGRLVKLMGDGALVEFASAVDAVRCALDIQSGIAERNADIPEDRRIEFRIGINVGDIIVDEGDIYGDGVNVAARIESLARPGGICLSPTAPIEQIKGKLALDASDMGEHQLKNIAEPVRRIRAGR